VPTLRIEIVQWTRLNFQGNLFYKRERHIGMSSLFDTETTQNCVGWETVVCLAAALSIDYVV
jgi:hypothetical protein